MSHGFIKDYSAGEIGPEGPPGNSGVEDWQAWTPTPTNFNVGTGGNAGITARFIRIGGLVVCELVAVLGTSGQSVPGNPSFTLPVEATAFPAGVTHRPVGTAILGDAGVAAYSASAVLINTTSIFFYRHDSSGSNVLEQALSSTTPFTWGANDWIASRFMYEAAE